MPVRFTLYFLDDRALVFRRIELECESDEEALSRLMELTGGQAMEIWRGGDSLSRFERLF